MDLHGLIDNSNVTWKIRVILHELVDRNELTSLVCPMPGCLIPELPMRLDNTLPRIPESLVLDHIICRADGGPDRLENLRAVHNRCNALNQPKTKSPSREPSRYKKRKYTSSWAQCSCGKNVTWGPTYRRHIGKHPKPEHTPVKAFDVTRQNGFIIKQQDTQFQQLPIGRPGWPTVYWDSSKNEWLIVNA